MAASTDPNLGLSHSWALDEDAWNTGMDANLKTLGALVQISVVNVSTSAQPGSPTEGAGYVVPSGHTWPAPASTNQIAVYANGAWRYYTPKTGWRIDNQADGLEYRFNGSVWTSSSASIAAGSITSAMILDGTIVNADINASAAIALTKLAAQTASRVMISDASGVMTTNVLLAYQTAAGPNLTVQAAASSHVPLVAKGATSQSGDLQQWQNSAGTVLACVDSTGRFMPGMAASVDLASAVMPFKDLWLAGSSGTPGTNNFRITGTATGARVVTLPDATITVAGSAAALTSGRVPYVTTGGLFLDSANFLWDNTLSKLTVNSIGLSRGVGNVVSNLALGNAAIAGAGAPGVYNTAVGFEALKLAQDLGGGGLQNSQGNTVVGAQAMAAGIVVGEFNVAVGYLSMHYATTAYCNVGVGIRTLQDNLTGVYNTAIGTDALKANTASNNTALGAKALLVNLSGTPNIGVGTSALTANTTGSNNVALGASALVTNISGNQNIAVGNDALKLATATGNIALGHAAGDNLTTGSRNIIIGYDIDAASASASDTLNIGNLIFATGVSGTGTTVSTGNVGIGTSAPQAKLDVRGLVWIRQADASYLSFTSDSTQATIDYSNTTGFRYTFNGSTTTFSIDSSSRVGIGGVAASAYNTQLGVTNLSAARIGLVIRLAASASAAAFEVQDSAAAQRFTILASGGFEIRNGSAAAVGAMIRGAASQTANLQEWQSSAGVLLFKVDASGFLGVGRGATALIAPVDVLGRTLNTDATDTIGAASLSFSVTKNDTNTRVFSGLQIKPTLNTGASNTNTTIDVLQIDTVNTAITGLTVNLIDAMSGGASKWALNSAGTVTVADGGNHVFGTTTGTKIGTATTQKLSFWNSTPIVQPNSTGQTAGFTAGVGSAVLSDSTFTGGVGTKAYTIGDIVAHLKNIGLIAVS